MAAKRAGYSVRSAAEIGWENLRKPQIVAAVAAGLKMIAHRCEIDADKIVRELAAVAFAGAYDFEVVADGSLAVAEDAPVERGLALKVTHRRVKKADGTIETETIYQQQDKVKALELLGKRLRLWVDKIETDNPQDALYRHLLDGLKRKQMNGSGNS